MAIVVVVFGLFADHQNDAALPTNGLRAEVLDQVSLIRAKLEGDINGDIAARARPRERHCDRAADHAGRASPKSPRACLQSRSQIRNIAGAPDLVDVPDLSRCRETRRRSGSTIAAIRQQRDAALRARDSGDVVLAGPLDLVQGGRGLHRALSRFHQGTRRRQDVLGHRFGGHRRRQALSRQRPHRRGSADRGRRSRARTPRASQARRSSASSKVAERSPGDDRRRRALGRVADRRDAEGRLGARRRTRWLLRLVMLAAGLMVVVADLADRAAGRGAARPFAKLARSRSASSSGLSRRLELALDTSKVGVWELQHRERRARLGRPHERALRLSRSTAAPRGYRHWRDRLDPTDVERAEQDFETAVRTERPLRIPISAESWATAQPGHPRDRQRLCRARRLIEKSSASIGTSPPTSR